MSMTMTMTVRTSILADRTIWGSPPGVPFAWVARAKFREVSYPVGDRIRLEQRLVEIDQPERHEIVGETGDLQRAALESWMASNGMDAVRRAVRHDGMLPHDDHPIEVTSGEYTIKAGPCGSGRYLYIMAWRTL